MSATLAERGFRVLILGTGKGEAARETAAAFAAHTDLLTDPAENVYAQYGFNKVARVLRRSGTVLVDRSGVIQYMHRVANPKDSLRKHELLAAVETMA